MGRPSLAEPRREQMLAAIARCIGKHGLAAASQEVIARESGFSRSHIRHYLGNRGQVVHAVWDYVQRPYWEELAAALDPEDPGVRTDRLMELFFGPEMRRKPEDLTIDALIYGSAPYPELRQKIENTYLELERQVSAHLRSTAPGIRKKAADEAAFSIISLAFGAATFSTMDFPQSRWLGAERMARLIIADLGAETAG